MEIAALRGPWRVVHVETSKRYTSPPFDKANRLNFSSSRVVVTYPKKSNIDQYRYSIDPMVAPKAIDLFSDRTPYERNQTFPLWAGVYEVDGNQLRISLSHGIAALKTQQRPLRIDPNSGDVLLVLERYRPADDERALWGAGR